MDTDKMRKKYGNDFVDKWMNSRMKTRESTRATQGFRNMRKINAQRAKASTAIKKSIGEGITREELINALITEFAPPREERSQIFTTRRPPLLSNLKKKTGLDRLANQGRMY